jgi:CheY-like chemotaxis protein
MKPTRPVTVLLVEDDDIDVEGVHRAFQKNRIANPIVVARNGVEALDRLLGRNQEPLPKPYIILLDLNMPVMGGLEFLQEIRDRPELRDSVVFVLTTSNADEDRVSAYRQHVAGYCLKSNVGPDFLHLTSLLKSYWRVVELPD